MQNSIFIGLIQNIALLLSFTLIYDYIWVKDEDTRKVPGQILIGILIGFITILLMTFNWQYEPGIVFDTRSIILSIAGLFFGAIPTIIAMIVAAIYRVFLGGDGMWMGLAVILSSGFIGMFWRLFFPPMKIKAPRFNMLFLGLVVHMVMLACILFLPKALRFETLKAILPTVLILYVPATMLLGMLMHKRWEIRKQQDEKDKEENRYRLFFEVAGEAILVAQEGYIKFANQRLGDMIGRSDEEILSHPFTDFIHPDDRDFVLQRHKDRVHHQDVPKHYSFRVVKGNGDVRWIEINSVYFEWNGEPSSLSFLTDVTSLRETSRQLVLAKNMAEESDRLKTVFLANLSHEIRTPMNAILGFSDLLKTEHLPLNKRKHYVESIQSSGEQLLNIINNIVDTSKLEINQLSISKRETPLYEIYEQSYKALKNNISLKDKKDAIDLTLTFPDEYKDLSVNTDAYRIRQILDNLLNNAVKYTEKGSIELKCIITANKKCYHIETHVIDTGSGIPENKRDIIFERFRQVEEDRYHEGAGLGLCIAKGIVNLMKGDIKFNSEVGKGSDFYFTLDLEKIDKVESIEETIESDTLNLEGRSILVAEDDQTSFYLIQEYLRDTGADIDHARDGRELMKKLEKRVPDLILLDINMPRLDGFESLKHIREKGYDCKIIAQTAYAMENEKERCFNSGCHGYVTKPIDPDVLYKEIQRVLSSK